MGSNLLINCHGWRERRRRRTRRQAVHLLRAYFDLMAAEVDGLDLSPQTPTTAQERNR
jgi:hypothetical protein